MNKIRQRDEIKIMIDEIEKRIDSDENRRRKSFWDEDGLPVMDVKKIPIKVTPEIQMWGRLHGVSLVDFYKIPETYVYLQLKSKLYAFDNFKDDQPIDRNICMWYGSPFEGTLFGLPCVFSKNFEPEDDGVFLDKHCREVLKGIKKPDFYASGLMPLVHRMYDECKQILSENFELEFPDYIQTPLQLAFHLTGIENFLMQVIDDLEGINLLLTRLMDIRVEFRKERARFLGIELSPGIFDNDAVAAPMISPEIYRDIVWPIEKELSVKEGGIVYWHSCGDTTKMMKWIRKLPDLRMCHVSAWCDCVKAAEVYGTEQALQVCVHPIREVLDATLSQMEERIKQIVGALGDHRFYINADCIQACLDMPVQIKKIQNWVETARRVIEKHVA
jgi:hypothetical protein